MIPPKFEDYDLDFTSLSQRYSTDTIVVHHTGDELDDDLSAEDIHRIHQAQGWSGIGYHYIIRKNGRVEIGRPDWSVGAHAYGENWHTVGVHVCGNFEIAEPTEYQIESLAYLLGWLCDEYGLDPATDIVGHKDLMATACPGENLYNMLDTIRGKAAWYMENCKEGD